MICGVLILVGIGVGFTFQPTLVALQAHTTDAKRAVVISDRNFFRCGGGAFGLAVSAAILQAVLKSNLPANFRHIADSTYAIPDRSTVSPADWDIIVKAYVKASHAVFIFQVPVIGLCLFGCLLIQDRGLEKPRERDEQENTTDSTADTEVDLEVQENKVSTSVSDRHIDEDTQREAGHDAAPGASSNAEYSEKA